MQVFVACPFCRKMFDSLIEPHRVLRIDGYVRTAHLRCAVPVPAPEPEPVKPDGGGFVTTL